MLYEQVEKREKEERGGGGVTTATGSCKFCRQVATCKVLDEWNREEIDELVTETCKCVDARIYVNKKRQKERANHQIDLLFGENNKSVTVPDAALNLLHEAVNPICEGIMQCMAIDIGNGVKGKINITSKGIIKVARTKTDKSTYEA